MEVFGPAVQLCDCVLRVGAIEVDSINGGRAFPKNYAIFVAI